MTIIHNNVDKFIALKPRYYKFLKTISFTRNISTESDSRYDLELILSKLLVGEDDLRIRFKNVFGIKIGCLEGMFGLYIDIEDVSDRQLEGGTYRVVEQEEQTFSFYCEEFIAELISNL
ncbi:MAG: hypothetical protein LUP96_08215 [Methylococcaceae bacterium]|nr:hypothetical protein [Methylococcaceae bacterium]